jgi:hypothetical protein
MNDRGRVQKSVSKRPIRHDDTNHPEFPQGGSELTGAGEWSHLNSGRTEIPSFLKDGVKLEWQTSF